MARHFGPGEWELINAALDADPGRYGFPERTDGSVLLGSFNIRKVGDPENRNAGDWAFLGRTCAQFDLLAIQEIMSDLGGLRRLQEEMAKLTDGDGEGFAAVVSDETGAFAGERGMRERLGFVYRWPVVERMEIASDLTYDRTKTLGTLALNKDALIEALQECGDDARDFDPPFFVTFARQPHGVAFRINGAAPYEFMAVNAHLIFGRPADRRREFTALLDLLKSRLGDDEDANLILMGDLNLNFDNPENDRPEVDRQIKDLDGSLAADGSHINFPFLDVHRGNDGVFRTNARLNQTYDHIGLFAHDPRLPAYDKNELMPEAPEGPDYGVFDFMELFSQAIFGRTWDDLEKAEREELWEKSEFSVSDHLPLWLRLPLDS